MFSQIVTAHWLPDPTAEPPPEPLPATATASGYRVKVDGWLPTGVPLMVLETCEGGGFLTLTAAEARRLHLAAGSRPGPAELRGALGANGLALHGADHLFYLPLDEQLSVRAEVVPGGTRQLSTGDGKAFAEFVVGAPPEDMDEAFVELDHWLVFGTFAGELLVAVASMYPWQDTHFADLGVITLPEYRRRGLGRRTVRAISARALAAGYEPQYRCQLDNVASASLAEAAGLVRFGTWDVIACDG